MSAAPIALNSSSSSSSRKAEGKRGPLADCHSFPLILPADQLRSLTDVDDLMVCLFDEQLKLFEFPMNY